jgi:hypothetical protein
MRIGRSGRPTSTSPASPWTRTRGWRSAITTAASIPTTSRSRGRAHSRRDAGDSWSFRRITHKGDAFIPLHGNDTFINPFYMGDYDALASDTLLGHAGFVGGFLIEGFQGNQNVYANRLDVN